jgi:hypothetical protein
MQSFVKTQWQAISPNAKWDAIKFSGAAVIAAAGYLLHKIGHLPDWTPAAGVFVAALLVFWFVNRSKRMTVANQPTQTNTTQVVVQGVGLETNIQAFEENYKKNSGQFLEEAEKLFQRLAAHFADPLEREKFLIRVLAGGSVVVLHNETWWVIWRSQIELLQELNTHTMILEQVKSYYDKAVVAYPVVYQNYSFEQWLAYLRSQNVILQDGSVIQLTVRGKDFLRFLIQEGRSANKRIF